MPDVIANKLDHLLILTSGTEQYLITCTNKKYKFLLTTTLTISGSQLCSLFINKDVIWDREQFPMDEIAYNNSMNEIDLLMYFSEHKQECANYYWNLPYQNLVKEYNGDKFISFAEYPLEYTYRFINLLKEEENIETEYTRGNG